MWQLVRLTFRGLWGRRSQKQRTVDCLLQTERSVDVTPQIGDNHLLVHDTVCSGESAVSRERDIHHPICKSESWRKLIENERSMRNVVNRDYMFLRGVRVGIVCHDGSCRFWEWDSGIACFVPLSLSSR